MREVFASRICGWMESFVLGWRIGKGAGSVYSIYKACKWVLVGGEEVLQGLQGHGAKRRPQTKEQRKRRRGETGAQ